MVATPSALYATGCSPEQRWNLYGSTARRVISMLTAIAEGLYGGVGTIVFLLSSRLATRLGGGRQAVSKVSISVSAKLTADGLF